MEMQPALKQIGLIGKRSLISSFTTLGLISLLVLIVLEGCSQAGQRINPYTGKQDYCVSILTVDGTVSNVGCYNLKVPNGDLTNNLDGTFTLNIPTGSLPSGSGTELQYRSGASTFGAVTGSGVSGGNVGLGSVNPSQKLDVNGTVKSTDFSGPGTDLTGTAAGLSVGGNAATATSATSATTAGTVTTAAQPNITSTGTLSSLIVSGNVGIGSVTPGQKLDVQGTIRSTAFTTTGAYTQSGASTNTLTGQVNVLVGSDGTGLTLSNSGGLESRVTITTNDTYNLPIDAGSQFQISNTNVNANSMTGIDFFNRDAGNNLLYSGIYTAKTVNTSGSGQTRMLFGVANGTGTANLKYPLTVLGSSTVGVNQTAPVNALSVNGAASFGTYSATTAPSNGLIVSGNIGIGTSVPDSIFTVNMAGSAAGSTNTLMTLHGNSASGNGTMLTVSATVHPTASVRRVMLDAKDEGGSARELDLQSNSLGPVCIGATGCSEALDVHGNIVTSSGHVTARAFIANDAAVASTFAYNVGINSLSPGAMLDVNGAVRSSVGFNGPYIKVSETQSSGVNSAALSQNTWNTLVLNTLDTDTQNIASLSSNQLTLPAGTYTIAAYGICAYTSSCQIRLYNATDSSVILIGSSIYAPNTTTDSVAYVYGLFTLSGSKAVTMQMNSSSVTGRSGLASGFGTEVYTQAQFNKIK